MYKGFLAVFKNTRQFLYANKCTFYSRMYLALKESVLDFKYVCFRSEVALLYNDRAVLENHHISAAFRIMKEEESNILLNLSREEYR